MLLEVLFLLGCNDGAVGEGEEGDDPAECTDGEDNDADGEIDCDDLGCASVCDGESYGTVLINEFMASNDTTVAAEEDGGFYDWFELYNPGDETVNLGGWTVTDDLAVPDKYPLSDELELAPGDFIVLWASDNEEELGAYHVGFHMAKEGEDLAVYRPDGSPSDELQYQAQATDLSAARVPDGSSTWEITENATPGESNGE